MEITQLSKSTYNYQLKSKVFDTTDHSKLIERLSSCFGV